PLVDRLVHAVGVQRVGRGAGDVIGRLERDGLRLAAVVRRQATGLGRIADQRGGGEQVGVVALATHGRIATGGADLRGARGALQERVGRLRVRTGGRVGQAVQVLFHHRVADEVLGPLVPVGHADEAGRSEVPLHAEVEVVGLQRHQARVLRAAGGTELFAIQDRAGRVAGSGTCVQV